MSQQILGNSSQEEFEYYKNLSFELKLDYSGSEDWRDYWNLDGKRANIQNGSDGMVFAAGPTAMDHACHAVLWTKESYSGNLKVEFELTRLDTVNRYVNILYFYTHKELEVNTRVTFTSGLKKEKFHINLLMGKVTTFWEKNT